MAKGRPFLLPVVIDDTREAVAHVPDSFAEVQWTKLPGGEGAGAFATRAQKLLGGSEMEPGRPRPGIETRGGVAAPPARKGFSKWWWALPVLGVAVTLLLVMKLGRQEPAPVKIRLLGSHRPGDGCSSVNGGKTHDCSSP